jgi:hypothetical protein
LGGGGGGRLGILGIVYVPSAGGLGVLRNIDAEADLYSGGRVCMSGFEGASASKEEVGV